ncbi:hypothetical protein ACWGNE_23800 [Streptomyces xiamenensis]
MTTARQASIGGAGSRFGHRAAAVQCWLSALVLTGLQITGQLGLGWWHAVITIGVSLLLLLLGLTIWSSAAEQKLDTERLLRSGRPAVAEVLGVEVNEDSEGVPNIAVLELRISGTDVPEFVASYRTDHAPHFRTGARFHAVVDPSDNLFTLRPL